MHLKYFRTYELAVKLYHCCKEQRLSPFLKDQLLRASSGIALCLAEGSAKPGKKDKLRYYHIALGSLREIQAILDLEEKDLIGIKEPVDQLGAHLYRLCKQ